MKWHPVKKMWFHWMELRDGDSVLARVHDTPRGWIWMAMGNGTLAKRDGLMPYKSMAMDEAEKAAREMLEAKQ